MGQKYDKEGKPISLYEWAKLFEDPTYQQIALTHLENGICISTVWLGMAKLLPMPDESIKDQLFETMIFDKDRNELFCQQYATLEEARAGHEKQMIHFDAVG